MISILYLCFVFESNVITYIRDKCIHSPSAIKRFIYWISLLLLYVTIPWGIGSVTILLIKPYIDQPTTNNPGISIAILAIMIDCGASIILTLIGFIQFAITSFKSITKERRYYQ